MYPRVIPVLVKAKGVYPSAVRLTGGVPAGEEAHTEEGVEVLLYQRLQRLLDGNGGADEFGDRSVADAEELDVAHEGLLPCLNSNTRVGPSTLTST